MRFLWPQLLWLLFAAPLLVAAYLYVLARRKRAALKFASLITVRAAMTGAAAWRRHVPPAIFLFGVLAVLIAIARPSALVTLPSAQRVIVLAIDVSLSMRAADVHPNRISAAQAAAKAFVQEVPSDVRIGIVSFAGTALLAQSPTNNREDLVAAIDRLQLDRQTAIGSGIVISLATLFPDQGIDLEPMVLGARSARGGDRKAAKKADPQARQPVAPGSNTSAAIVLLTDGRRTTGPDPLVAARMAAERGIRIFTVGFGSAQGGHASVEGYSIYMAFDEETLKAIADLTRAEYFHAASAAELTKIYEALSSRLVLQKEHTEVTALFVAAAALLLLVSAALSLLWFNRAL